MAAGFGLVSQLRDQGVEPADGLEVRLYDYDASDQGEALWLGNDGVLVRDDEADRWLVAFDPDTLDWEPRST